MSYGVSMIQIGFCCLILPVVGYSTATVWYSGTSPMKMRPAVNASRLIACLLAVAAVLPGKESTSDEKNEASKPAADSMLGDKPGQVRDDNAMKLKMVWCPPGNFTMVGIDRKSVV